MNKLDIFRKRLSKLNIDIQFIGNYPWIYINTINGKRVTELFEGNHGFTIAFSKYPNGMDFTDISEIFKLIRKYI